MTLKKLISSFTFMPFHLWCLALLCSFSTYAAQEAADISDTIPSEFPSISIKGKKVVTLREQQRKHRMSLLPDTLKSKRAQSLMNKPKRLRTFRHNPETLDRKAPVQIIEFMDLSCAKCMEDMQQLQEAYSKDSDKINLMSVYTPSDQYNTANLAAFYGKIAQKEGVYWDYRERLLSIPEPTADTYFNLLLDIGIEKRDARNAAARFTRKFYKELDADAMMARRLKLKKPPYVYVNGVLVGEKGLPFDVLGDLVQYYVDMYDNGYMEN